MEPIGGSRIEAPREGVTRTAAAGFVAGGLAGLMLGGAAGSRMLVPEAIDRPLGAVAARCWRAWW